MRPTPFELGTIHFVGIGGIGMSGIAEVMHNLGARVTGSDVSENANVLRLRSLGMTVHVGHAAENVADDVVAIVTSTAIKSGNPEVDKARAKKIPVVRRADMLAELMRLKWCVSIAGTHGKTTTTSMVAAVLDAGKLDPTVVNGGIINAYGTNARLGTGDWMVVEADESDGSFLRLPATIAIVTNIDPEHLDHYGSFKAIQAAFRQFIEHIPFYGTAILCTDHPVVQDMMGGIIDRRCITYGYNAQADVKATNVSFSGGIARFDVSIAASVTGEAIEITGLELPMPGRHNVQNALSAITVGLVLGLGVDVIREAFAGFGGVKRRFTRTGVVDGVTVIDDYGHHPVEIANVLAAARENFDGRIIAVVQPHRYTRLQSLFGDFCTCFNDADTVIVAPIYSAGEAPIEGAGRDDLVAGLRARGHKDVRVIDSDSDLAPLVNEIAEAGDAVVCLGAGSITLWANALPTQLEALKGA